MKAALAILALLLALTAGAAAAKPPVWIVHGTRGTLVLFGSAHLLPAGLDWRPAALADALGRADSLWFEIPVDQTSDAEALAAVARDGFLPAGESLFDHLSPEDGQRLRRVAQAQGADLGQLQRMRPWLAELTLSVAADQHAGALVSEGVERQIQALAPATVRRRAFETAGEQIALLSGGTGEEQAAALAETVREIDTDPQGFRKIVDEWMASDLAAVDRDALAPIRKAAPGVYRRLVIARNHRWASAIARQASQDGVTVVVVGFGHLLGPDGLPALLRADGLRVEGP